MDDTIAEVDDLASTLKLLKCVVCDNILSVPPVLTISEHEYQCGRCKDIKYSKVAMRNVIFEKVGKYLSFPCVYTNCDTMILWKDVQTHEKDCPFKTIICPIFHEGCDEKIKLTELTQHMVQKHGNNIFYENIMVTVAIFKSFVCVASVNDEIFLVYICNDKVLVTSLKSSMSMFNYTLKLCSSEKNAPSIVYENQPIEEFHERKHCFRCLDKRCNERCHPFSTFNKPTIDDTGTNGTRSADKLKKVNFSRPPTFKNISLAAPPTTKAATYDFFSQTPTLGSSTSLLNTLPCTVKSAPATSTDNEVPPSTMPVTSNAKSVSTTSSSLFGNTVPSRSIKNIFGQTIPSSTPFVPATSTESNCIGITNSTRSTLNVNAPAFSFQSPANVSTFTFASPIDVNTSSVNNDVKKSSKGVDKNESVVMNTSNVSHNDDTTDVEQTQLQAIKCTTYNISHIQNLIGVTSSVTFTITISCKENTESSFSYDSFIPRNLLSTIDNSDLLRKTLECPICTEYMVDSIYVCNRGHHICSKCRMLSTCPSCQGVISDARNFALEHMAEGVSLCCTFKENGCEFRGNLKTISEHEKNCSLYKEQNGNVM